MVVSARDFGESAAFAMERCSENLEANSEQG